MQSSARALIARLWSPLPCCSYWGLWCSILSCVSLVTSMGACPPRCAVCRCHHYNDDRASTHRSQSRARAPTRHLDLERHRRWYRPHRTPCLSPSYRLACWTGWRVRLRPGSPRQNYLVSSRPRPACPHPTRSRRSLEACRRRLARRQNAPPHRPPMHTTSPLAAMTITTRLGRLRRLGRFPRLPNRGMETISRARSSTAS